MMKPEYFHRLQQLLQIQMSAQDCQEDCTVYIEELKSDNPSLKLNAASKITFIASALGHNRLKDQLIPYIIEIIDEMDNDIEFLAKVAEQMAGLKSHCRSINESYILIQPLYKLAALDQPAVREKAIESLEELAKDQNQAFFRDHYFPLIKRMAGQEISSHSPRVAVCRLIPICYPKVNPERQAELRQIFNKLGLSDDSPMVRRSLAQSIEAYSEVVPKQIMRTQVLQIWQKFIQDIIDVIRIKALEIVPIMARFFKKEEMPEKFIKYMKIVDSDKKSWRIRYSLVQAWANVLGYVEKSVIKKDIKQSFDELLKDPEYEVRSISMLKLALLSQNLPKQVNTEDLLPHVERLSKDTASAHVRQSVAESLAGFLKCVDEEAINTKGVTLVQSLLKDQSIAVRICLIEWLKEIIQVIGAENTKRCIIPLITSNSQDNKWRYRVSIVEKFVDLGKALGFDAFQGTIESLLKGFLRDHYYSVREQAFKILGDLIKGFGDKKGKPLVSNLVMELAKDPNFIFRVSACQAIVGCKSGLTQKDLSELFLGVVRQLKEEKVANVLINLCKTYSSIKSNLTLQAKNEWAQNLHRIRESKDEDVQYYASKAE